MYNGMLGAVGGVIGKAIFAYFVSALILPLFSGKNPFKGMSRGIKSFITGIAVKSANEAGQLVIGIGLALIEGSIGDGSFCFFSMPLVLKQQGRFLKGSIGSFAHKKAQTANISYC